MINTLYQAAICICCALTLVQCASDTKEGSKEIAKTEVAPPVQRQAEPAFKASTLPLPDACSLLTIEDIQEILNVPADEIQVKDGSTARAGHAKSCFFKWIGKRINAGLLVQVQKNPVGDEFPEWPTSFVASKRTSGESNFSGDGETYKYSKFEGLGDDGSYSYNLEKYIWRTGNDYVYMIAFNEDMTEAEQKDAALRLGKKIMQRVGK